MTHVLHFASNMGGMGAIHDDNDFVVYRDNHNMTINVLDAAIKHGVTRFLFASSACVYPDGLQRLDSDVRLSEDQLWAQLPPQPQGLYGEEKLASELLLLLCSRKIEIRVARFHNSPARLRERSPTAIPSFEIWGDGRARRSFLYIDDCVDAVLKLLASDHQEPLNIGTEDAVSIKDLADLALDVSGLQPSDIEFTYDLTRPVGVASRNSHNERVREVLGWEPQTSLRVGMKKTAEWMSSELDRVARRDDSLASMQHSVLVQMDQATTRFAILLPVTSRSANGVHSKDPVEHNLRRFARSLLDSMHGDLLGGTTPAFSYRIYILVDHDDMVLADGKVEQILVDAGVPGDNIVTLPASYVASGRVCTLWRNCARRAYLDHCDYYILLGDDVEIHSPGWMSAIHCAFAEISSQRQVPQGFGCVAFTDMSFPGMPTFPVVHRTHMDMFNGEVVPDIFVNQDGDPYLFALYRKFGCSRMLEHCQLTNAIGGSAQARYAKESALSWSFEPLRLGVARLRDELAKRCGDVALEKITIDVVVPSFRVQMPYLDAMLSLRPSQNCETMYIVIIDDPCSPAIDGLLAKYGHRVDVRIRVNDVNMGASASRNRGMAESSAEWILFLDDDVSPEPDLLLRVERYARDRPLAAGFVGHCKFPVADTVFKAAVHLAGVTYFWSIATQIPDDLPWGVTANLVARRSQDGVAYSLDFPKTGGGEDIDFCRKKTVYSVENGGEAFYAAPDAIVTHPWWKDGQRSYWRFYMWSIGDGALIRMYPQHSYRDFSPNAAESLLLVAITFVAGTLLSRVWMIVFSLKVLGGLLLSNVIVDMYRHMYRDEGSNIGNPSRPIALPDTYKLVAVLESTFIRIFSEMGRTMGILQRQEYGQLGMRFDWFTGRFNDGPKINERKNNALRTVLAVFLTVILYSI
ncbi:glycosyltransferase family 2 protein [Schizophyllum amplum]|uniref:Glycosyltransferase family 2 protein n=1 Tax=Schizophyllum amplum TaxID=97359 RepID=A0A550CGN4_9AGAR|nr:glycosyltransferase family 2 protein [Auriculariopsis ampla]